MSSAWRSGFWRGFGRRALSTKTCRGACLAQARDSIPRVILLGRLSLYGRGAERLHEELVPVAARWIEASKRQEPLKAYARETELRTLDLLEEALTGDGVRVPNETIQHRLLETAAQDIEELLPQLEPRAFELAEIAAKSLAERGVREERDLRATLERQRRRVVEELEKYDRDFTQLTLGFHMEERRQVENNMRGMATAS